MTTVEKQEDVVGGLFEALIGDGFTGYYCGPKDDPHAVIAVYEWPDHLDVITMPRKGPAAAARLAKPAVRVPDGEPNPLVLNPPTTALWAWVGPMDMAVWALLDLPHPECPNAPAAEIQTPAALSVPREQQRPMHIRVPDEEKASTRAVRRSQPRPPKIMSKQFFNDLVVEVDSRRAIGFALNFTEDGKLTFGNFKTLVGRTAITEFTEGFFSQIRSVKHQIDNYWRQGEQLAMVNGRVTFTRLDGSTVTMPYASVSHFTPDGTLLTHHRTYFDPSPVVGVTVPD
jgi:hypothetical protein